MIFQPAVDSSESNKQRELFLTLLKKLMVYSAGSLEGFRSLGGGGILDPKTNPELHWSSSLPKNRSIEIGLKKNSPNFDSPFVTPL